MNDPSPVENFARAAELFRENETMFGDVKQDKEKANFYGGLAALADGLAQMQQQRLKEQNEEERQRVVYRHPASVRPR